MASSWQKMAEAASSRTPEAWQSQTVTANPFSMINIVEDLGRLYLAEETTVSLGVSLGSVNSSDDNSRHLQSLVSPRPAVPKKAVIASLDAIKLKLTPQRPRRAISAKTTNALHKAAHMKPKNREIIPTNVYTARSIIGKRKYTRISGQRRGVKPKAHVWRLLPWNIPKKVRIVSQISGKKGAGWSTASEKQYSNWPRVQGADESKKMEIQKTGVVDFRAKGLPETPPSVVSTPTELYHYSVSQSNPQPTHPQRALQPISPNTGWAQSTLPTPNGVTSTGNSNSTSLERASSARSITLRSGSILTMISPEETAWDRPVYQHRPICSDKQSALSHKNSIATIEPFLDAVEIVEAERRRASDDAAVDEIVNFFESLGIYDTSGKCGLDRFWDTSPRPPSKALTPIPLLPRSPVSPASSLLLPPPPPRPRLRNSTSPPRAAPRRAPQAQKMKLRLLNSASSIV